MPHERAESVRPRVVSRDLAVLSPWVTLETISVAALRSDSSTDVYHALRQPDYVNVLVMTPAGGIVLVRQFRPVIGEWTLELPGGLREADESPDETVRREVREETGFVPTRVVPLVTGFADVGRLTNRFFGFFALAERGSSAAERGITTIVATGDELRAHAASGRLASQNQMGLLYLAAIHPQVREVCRDCGLPGVPWLG